MTELEFTPYTKQKMAVREIVEISHHPVKINNDDDLWELEKYYGLSGEFRKVWRINTPEGQKINSEVLEHFGLDLAKDLGTHAVAKMTPQNIISAAAPEGYFLSPDGLIFAALKFYVDDKTACLKTYWLHTDEVFPELPEGIEVMMVANYETWGKAPFPEELVDCHDVFFFGDHDVVSSFFGKKLPEGKYVTGYGVRYRHGKILKMKSYAYDEPTPQSQWRGIKQMHKMVCSKGVTNG